MQQSLQPLEDEAEAVADGGQHGVGMVAVSSVEAIAVEMAVCLHMADHRLDGGPSPELLLDGAEDSALPAEDEDAERLGYAKTVIWQTPRTWPPPMKPRSDNTRRHVGGGCGRELSE